MQNGRGSAAGGGQARPGVWFLRGRAWESSPDPKRDRRIAETRGSRARRGPRPTHAARGARTPLGRRVPTGILACRARYKCGACRRAAAGPRHLMLHEEDSAPPCWGRCVAWGSDSRASAGTALRGPAEAGLARTRATGPGAARGARRCDAPRPRARPGDLVTARRQRCGQSGAGGGSRRRTARRVRVGEGALRGAPCPAPSRPRAGAHTGAAAFATMGSRSAHAPCRRLRRSLAPRPERTHASRRGAPDAAPRPRASEPAQPTPS